jgi:hypothetical protein
MNKQETSTTRSHGNIFDILLQVSVIVPDNARSPMYPVSVSSQKKKQRNEGIQKQIPSSSSLSSTSRIQYKEQYCQCRHQRCTRNKDIVRSGRMKQSSKQLHFKNKNEYSSTVGKLDYQGYDTYCEQIIKDEQLRQSLSRTYISDHPMGIQGRPREDTPPQKPRRKLSFQEIEY